MSWSKVGDWLKGNAGTGAALVGSLLTGNVPGAVAAGVALVSGATGTTDPAQALEALQANPETVLKLRELAVQDADNIRRHIQTMEEIRFKDEQEAHRQQQETIRSGDNAEDSYVRQTRPLIARQSWYATAAYLFIFEALQQFGRGDGASIELAMLMIAPAGAYIGFRTMDKWRSAK
jgi:hypothetical protein